MFWTSMKESHRVLNKSLRILQTYSSFKQVWKKKTSRISIMFCRALITFRKVIKRSRGRVSNSFTHKNIPMNGVREEPHPKQIPEVAIVKQTLSTIGSPVGNISFISFGFDIENFEAFTFLFVEFSWVLSYPDRSLLSIFHHFQSISVSGLFSIVSIDLLPQLYPMFVWVF